MSAREQDVDVVEDGDKEGEETEETSGKSFNWSLIISLVSLLGVVALWVAMPSDRSRDVDWLLENAVSQGDSLRAVADTVAAHEARLDRHWERMNDIERTMAVASKVDSLFGVVRNDIGGLQKVAGRIKKLESEAKQSLDLSKLTREELELLKRTFGDHAALRSRDAHGNQKVALSNSSANSDDWWEFISQGKGGSK
ncbi:MAG: hypothetical protein Q8Q92_03695 [bacterium]|nr:hypothetical protein [bacterium]